MPVQRKVFRIEQIGIGGGARPRWLLPSRTRNLPHDEILGELQALRTLLERCGGGRVPHPDAGPTGDFDQFNSEASAVHEAIARIKQEIVALRVGPFEGGPGRATRELDAVAAGAERATQQIITAAEDIEDAANTLAACLQHGQQKALAQDIRIT